MTAHVLAISGSLRRASLNTSALRAAATLVGDRAHIELADISDIPLYNGDIDDDGGPEPVRRLRTQVANTDGLLISTPEYNYSIPGVLKNVIDWVSRPAYKSAFVHKPVAVFSVAASPVGGARAQAHLKQVLLGVLCHVFPAPELALGPAVELFEDGELTDEDSRRRLGRLVTQFADHLGSPKL